MAQKADPSPGDFVNIVDSDLKKLNLNMDYKGIESMNKEFFKNMVKKKVKEAAFKHLKEYQTFRIRMPTLHLKLYLYK